MGVSERFYNIEGKCDEGQNAHALTQCFAYVLRCDSRSKRA